VSHHLDTPLAAQTGQLFPDDLYVFPANGSTVLVMDVNSNVNGLHCEPGFHPEARYEFKVHFDGRTQADNAPEAMLSLVAGMAVPSGLRPSVAAAQRTRDFPCVVAA
jgi:hypothetical protein